MFLTPSILKHMKHNLAKNKRFSVLLKKLGTKLFLSAATAVLVVTSIFPRVASAQSLELSQAIWVQSWVPEEFVNTLPASKERPRRVMWVTVTAYSSTPDQTDDTPFIAASGKRVFDGMVAANFLRFGTRVKFPDYFNNKAFFVEDRMHERFSDRMDIWFETREQAKKFGIRRLRVEIY